MEKILQVKDLKVSFQTFFGEVEAVRGISFDVEKGKTLAIVGESGCGKSVTAGAIMKLHPQPPVLYKAGQIIFEGQNLIEKTETQMNEYRGQKIAMIFQDPMTSLNPTMKIGKQIVEGLIKHQKIDKTTAQKKVIELLEMVAVPQADKRVNQYPHEFSGGMRQRVMIALAMSCNPSLLIADEPTTALDVTVQAQILDLMADIQKQMGMSIILITHDLGIVADKADDVVVMYAGQIVEQGKTNDIFYNPSHPYTKNLLSSVPRPNMNKNEPLYSIQGTPPDLYKPPTGCGFFDRCNSSMHVCNKFMPDFTSHNEFHLSRCFLNHEFAKEVKDGKIN